MNEYRIKGKMSADEPLARHTTVGIGGPCSLWVEPASLNELKKVLAIAKREKRKLFVLGKGSNVLFSDKGFGGIVIHLGARCFKYIKKRGTRLVAGAGTPLALLINEACKQGLCGLEGLVGIPASFGGAIAMNASYRQGIKDVIESVKVLDRETGSVKTLKKSECAFGYRTSKLARYIILEATLKLGRGKKKELLERASRLMALKKMEQPLSERTCGCVFRNPKKGHPAGRCIDMLGMKGTQVGRARISERHANFIVNTGGARSDDFIALMKLIRRRVKQRYNMDLMPEIVVV